jgi:hypothetical protein
MESLSDLESVVPVGARGALITAAQILLQIDTQAESLCPSCGGASIDIVPPFVTGAVADGLLNNVASIFTVDAVGDGGKPRHQAKHPKHSNGQAPVDGSGGVTGPGSSTVTDPTDSTDGTGKGGHPGHHNGGPIDHLTGALGGNGDDPVTLPSGVPDLSQVDDALDGVGDVLGGVLGSNNP